MNSSRLAILTLVLGLALGFGIGFMQGGVGDSIVNAADPSGPAPSPPLPASDGANETAPATLAAVSDSTPSKSSSSSPSGPAVSAEAKRLAQRVSAAASGQSQDASAWDGVIRGSIQNELGEPLEGATVVSGNNYSDYRTNLRTSSTHRIGRAYTGPGDLEDSISKTAESQLKRRRNTRTATSDSQGMFELTGLKGGTHSLSVYAEGYTFSGNEYEVGSDVEIIGKAVSVFVLDVRLPDGSVPEEAVVSMTEDRGNSTSYKWTAAEPELRLRSSNVEFKVFSGHVRRLEWRETIADYVSKDQSLSLSRDGKGPHLIELEASQLCQVQVTDTSGIVPVIRPWVKIVTAEQHGGSDFNWTKDTAVALTREKGSSYAAKDLPEGNYIVGVGRGGDEPEVTEPLQVLSGLTTLEISLGELDISRFLVLKCTAPNGRPANDVTFSSSAERKEGGTTGGGADSLKRGKGEYWIASNQLLHGSVWSDIEVVRLTASSKDYGTMELEITESKKELTLAFAMPCELVVTVAGDHSAGYRATISEYKEGKEGNMNHRYYGGSNDRNSKKVDADGRALFTGKQPGEYQVSLTKTGLSDDRFAGWNKPAACKEIVTLREGTNEITVTLPTFHTLTVYAPGQKKGTNFQLKPEDSDENDYFSGARGELGDDERVTFEDVAAGTYSLSSWNSMGSNMTVTVPCGEVTFEVTEPNCLKVTNVQPGKTGAEAGLKNGDLITGIDGKPFEGQMGLGMATMKMMASEVTLNILRGNSQIDIQIGPIGETREAMTNMGFSARPHTRE